MKASGKMSLVLSACASAAIVAGCTAVQKMGEAMPGVGQYVKVADAGINEMQKEQDDKKMAILNAKTASTDLDGLIAAARTSLSEKLPEIEEVKKSDTQKILAFGEFRDMNPDLVSQETSEEKLEELRTGLISSETIKNSFVIVDRSSESVDQIKLAVAGAGNDPSKLAVFDDPAQRKASTVGPTVYNPNDIYIFSAKFAAEDNGASLTKDTADQRKITYTLFVQMLHANSGSVAYAQSYAITYKWDSKTSTFVPAA